MAATKWILLVEDEAIIAAREEMIFRREGYAVVLAYSGEEAVQKAAAQAFDLILMDINLGNGMDGTQAAQAILQEQDIPIVFLSSHTAPEVVEKTERITSYGYVVKDTGATVLAASVKMAFRLHAAYREILRVSEDLKNSEQNLRIHQVELDMQNEELRSVQSELTAARDHFIDLYEFAPVGYLTLDPYGLILEANLTAAVLLNVARGALARQPLSSYILPGDQDLYYHRRSALSRTGSPQDFELRMLRKGGLPFRAWLTLAKAPGDESESILRLALSEIPASEEAGAVR